MHISPNTNMTRVMLEKLPSRLIYCAYGTLLQSGCAKQMGTRSCFLVMAASLIANKEQLLRVVEISATRIFRVSFHSLQIYDLSRCSAATWIMGRGAGRTRYPLGIQQDIAELARIISYVLGFRSMRWRTLSTGGGCRVREELGQKHNRCECHASARCTTRQKFLGSSMTSHQGTTTRTSTTSQY
jgi:hypothetical protein